MSISSILAPTFKVSSGRCVPLATRESAAQWVAMQFLRGPQNRALQVLRTSSQTPVRHQGRRVKLRRFMKEPITPRFRETTPDGARRRWHGDEFFPEPSCNRHGSCKKATNVHSHTLAPNTDRTMKERLMKKLVSLTILFAAVAILGTALTAAATDESSPSNKAPAKSKCCQDKSVDANTVANETPKSDCRAKAQTKTSVLAKAESCNGGSCKLGEKDAGDCKLCATDSATTDVTLSANVKSDAKACSDGQCKTPQKPASCCKASAASQVVANPPCADAKKQCPAGTAGQCKGESGQDVEAKLTSEVPTCDSKCKDGPEKDSKGDCGICASAMAVSTAKPGAQKCGSCSEKDCKEECSACAEARKETATAGSDDASAGNHRGMGRGMGHGHADDSQHQKDHQDFFYLIENRDSIRRTVKNIPNGVETLTESNDDDVASRIQEHVEAMYGRMEEVNPIRMRDPLFREVFANADKIKMEVKHTDHGVRVTETSDDEYAVKLIQAHAKVVSLWIKNGYSELPKNHAAPQH